MLNFKEKADHIWDIADLLRNRYKQSEYGKVILPFTVLRRLDIILAPTKQKVLAEYAKHRVIYEDSDNPKPEVLEKILNRASGLKTLHNRSPLDFAALVQDHNQLKNNLQSYIRGFSSEVQEIFIEHFNFDEQIEKLDRFNLLFSVAQEFNNAEHIFRSVDSIEMGYIFEELIRRFAEGSNETAGEHFTPREVIRLMVNLLFREDEHELTKPNIVKTLYDPACGTGGMLAVAEEYLLELNPKAKLIVFGQEINPESYAICKSDMLIKGHDIKNLKFGDTFTEDRLFNKLFDYALSNPPFGVDWKNSQDFITKEHEKLGYGGRFGPGVPPISDGSLLFLLNMIDKMQPVSQGGSRIGIVFNGSPLFSGGAGSGSSEIRRWIIENDWLEAIIALPDQLFYNTGIYTYIWILTNNKQKSRKGKIQLINASGADSGDKNNPFYVRMSRSLGSKRKQIGDGREGRPDQIGKITNIFFDLEETDDCKIFENHRFGYWRITVERPLRLNFQVGEERILKIDNAYRTADFEYLDTINAITDETKRKSIETEALAKFNKDRVFTPDEYASLRFALSKIDADTLFKDRAKFLPVFDSALKEANFKPTPKQRKLVLNLLSERDETAEICRDKKGNPEPDPELRDYENIPLRYVPEKVTLLEIEIDVEAIDEFFYREVLPHVRDAWIDWTKTKVGYEINFTRYFYKFKPLRSLAEIQKDILAMEEETEGMIKQVINA